MYWLVGSILRPASTLYEWNVGICLLAVSLPESPSFFLWLPPPHNTMKRKKRKKKKITTTNSKNSSIDSKNPDNNDDDKGNPNTPWSWTWPWLVLLVSICAMMIPIPMFVLLHTLWLETGNGEANFVFFQCLALNILVLICFVLFVLATVQWDKLRQFWYKEHKIRQRNNKLQQQGGIGPVGH